MNSLKPSPLRTPWISRGWTSAIYLHPSDHQLRTQRHPSYWLVHTDFILYTRARVISLKLLSLTWLLHYPLTWLCTVSVSYFFTHMAFYKLHIAALFPPAKLFVVPQMTLNQLSDLSLTSLSLGSLSQLE